MIEEGVQRVEAFLDEHPDAQDSLQRILALDAETSSWEFEEIPLDSGQFGELVSRGIAEQTDAGGYRLADHEAVQMVLSGEQTETTTKEDDPSLRPAIENVILTDIDRLTAVTLVGSLLLVALARLLSYPAVMRDGRVLSPANDPYFYRYWQAELLDQSSGIADTSMLTAVVTDSTRPLTHFLNWWLAELLGGSPEAAATVVAWLPVVMAVLTGVVVYHLTAVLVRDRRVAITAVVLYALAPGHAALTGIGYIDHHVYQYFWLAVLAFSLVWLAVDFQRRQSGTDSPSETAHNQLRDRSAWWVITLLAVAVWASAHIWTGSILIFVPVALSLWLRSLSDLRTGVPPLLGQLPVFVGLGIGGVLAALFHLQFGWHNWMGGFGPLLVLLGGLGTAAMASGWVKTDYAPAVLAGIQLLFGIVAVVGVRLLMPGQFDSIISMARTFVSGEDAVGSSSLFSASNAVLFEPLFQTGIVFYFALAPLGIATWLVYRRYEPAWLVLICFSWVFVLLATIRLRFVAQLLIFLSIFAATAVIYLLSALELARPVDIFDSSSSSVSSIQIPGDRTRKVYTVGVLAFLLGLNLLFVPLLLNTTTYSGEQHDAVRAIETHADETNREYPENYVLTSWSENRMYNYFVNGEARGYTYARANYERFLASNDSAEWYDRFNNRVGYIVTGDAESPEGSVHETLHEHLGTGGQSVAHYQLIHFSETIRVFALVEGAVIRIKADPGTIATANTTIERAGEALFYQRTATADDSGTAQIRVAYPGEYEVGDRTVQVSEQAVYDGEIVTVG